MRPVDKGHRNKEYRPYSTAKRDLFEAIGPYCSYCERKVSLGGAVEHVQPKSKVPMKQYDWDNFLLGCVNCNSRKGGKTVDDTNISDFVWPDIDDTYHMIEYDPTTLMPLPSPTLNPDDQKRVANLISLVGLNAPSPKESSKDYMSASDTRVEDRIKSSVEARDYKDRYLNLTDEAKPEYLKILMDLISRANHWSIWMHEMEDVPELREALLNLLPGTRKSCFE